MSGRAWVVVMARHDVADDWLEAWAVAVLEVQVVTASAMMMVMAPKMHPNDEKH